LTIKKVSKPLWADSAKKSEERERKLADKNIKTEIWKRIPEIYL